MSPHPGRPHRTTHRNPLAAIAVLVAMPLCAGLSGCAHYALPINRLDTPEARGQGLGLEALAVSMGSDLIADSTLTSAGEGETPVPMVQSTIIPSLGSVLALNEKVDIGVRLQSHAPLAFKLKYQLSGEPETRAAQGNFSTAISISPGLLLGSEGSSGTSFFSGDLTFLAGYRVTRNQLVSLSPFFGFGSVSGVSRSVAGTGTSVSATHYGAALGYQYALEALILRSEIAYGLGSAADASIGGLFFGGMLGFSLN